jgi:hypothetical protein
MGFFLLSVGGFVFVHVVKLHVFTFLVSFGDVRYDFHVKTMSLLVCLFILFTSTGCRLEI